MSTWFGRGRVQDRVEDSDDKSVIDDPSAPGQTASIYGTNNDARTMAAAADAVRAERESGRAIDALRAATTAAGAQVPGPTLAQITEIRRLHELTIEAARRPRHRLSKASARRRLQAAIFRRTEALQSLGFDSFDAFIAANGTTSDVDQPGSDETMTRICELLTELGVDPLPDPLRAASQFLTAHESEMTEAGDAETVADDAIFDSAAFSEGTFINGAFIDAVVTNEAPRTAPGVAASGDTASGGTASDGAELEIHAPSLAELEPEAPWVAAAHLPIVEPPTPQPAGGGATAAPARGDDVVDRWVNAEDRAERMHSEVDRAQAELVAMLARSAELEESAVARVNELDAANAQLEVVRRRVGELEDSIAHLEQSNEVLEQSKEQLEGSQRQLDAERGELERALMTGRSRVTELEVDLSERELAQEEAARERANALDALADLEATLAARTSDLEEARSSVAELELELITQTAELDHTRGELETARAGTDELTAELETTRRALDALDAHAEAIEAELAEARRAADSADARRELDTVRQELTEARHELGHLELQRAETDRLLAHERLELQQIQNTLTTTCDEAMAARDELIDARRTVDETMAQVEAAERARDAITIDAADLLARAEAEATSLLERANRDAEAIRQEAAHTSGVGQRFEDDRPLPSDRRQPDSTLDNLVGQVERLERKLAKQRRRLDQLARSGQGRAGATRSKPAKSPKPVSGHNDRAISPDSSAVDVIASAEREAAEIRRAARRDRERFRAELVSLLSRLAPLEDDDDDEDEDDD